MKVTSLASLLSFSAWANARLLTVAARVDESLLHVESPFLDHGTAFGTLLHLFGVEWSWSRCARGLPMKPHLPQVVPLPDLAALRAFAGRFDAELAEWVGSLSEQMLAEPVDVGTATGGQPNFTARANILGHLVVHGTQHRSELAHYLTSLGHSPSEIDYMDYVLGLSPAVDA